jgi:hypothetical protein
MIGMAATQEPTIEALTGAEDYFLKVMKPNYDAFPRRLKQLRLRLQSGNDAVSFP